jgi:SAM-dependent MidA family methyltransferase
MSEDFTRIASALERIAESLEKKWHIDIDHGHIEKIDNIEHGDIDTHQHSF